MASQTVSAKIPDEMKEKIKEHHIQVSRVIRDALQHEIKKREAQRIRQDVEDIEPILKKMRGEDVIRLIREDRER
ncbi:MAG: CopG family transcriptional regulator [Thermoplasmatota archaeon]